MANTFTTTDKVADLVLPEFMINVPLVENANMQLQNQFTKGGLYGIGGNIQVLKQPRFPVEEIDISGATLPSGYSVTLQDIQQETETLTIEKFFNTAVSLNAVEQSLSMRTEEGFNDYLKNPIINALKQKIMGYLYNKVISQTYIFTGNDSSRINNYQTVSDANAIMSEFQMPEERCFIMSPTDASSLSASQVSNNFYQPSLDDIWRTGLIGIIDGFKTYRDNNIAIFIAGTANTNTSLTLNTAATDGATTLEITGFVIGQTVKIGDKFQIPTTSGQPGEDIYMVQPMGKTTISNVLAPLTFVASAAPASNPDYDPVEEKYTATSATMTVSIVNPVRLAPTGDQYAYITSPSDTLPASLSLNMLGNHRVNPAFCKGISLSVAAPPLADLKYGAQSSRTVIKSISMQQTIQSDSDQYVNKFVLALQMGALVHPEYTVGVLSAA